MSKFIELTTIGGVHFTVNCESIILIEPDPDRIKWKDFHEEETTEYGAPIKMLVPNRYISTAPGCLITIDERTLYVQRSVRESYLEILTYLGLFEEAAVGLEKELTDYANQRPTETEKE